MQISHTLRYIPCLFSLILCSSIGATVGKTFFHDQSQRTHAYLYLLGLNYDFFHYNSCSWHGKFDAIAFYSHTRREKELGEFIFFNNTNTMKFGKQGAPDTDIFARNFFLNDDFEGGVTTEPSIENFVTHFYIHFGFDTFIENLYLRIHMPVTWTQWQVNLSQCITTTGIAIAAETFGNEDAASSPLGSIINAWKGNKLDPCEFPDLEKNMHFATINGKQSREKIADISFMLGYDIVRRPHKHLTLFAEAIFPTGTRVTAQFLFEPIVGSGRHIQLGAGIRGFHDLWSDGVYRKLLIFFDARIAHFFSSTQRRTFDLHNNGIGSRYLLFKRFNQQTGMYAGEILFGPNVTSRISKVDIAAEGELTGMLQYRRHKTYIDVGGNLWARSKEKIKITELVPNNTFGIQGNTTTIDNNTAHNTHIDGSNAEPDPTPVFLKIEDFNLNSAEHPFATTGLVFIHLSRNWTYHPNTPYLGIGGDLAFSLDENNSPYRWEIWVKTGFTFG